MTQRYTSSIPYKTQMGKSNPSPVKKPVSLPPIRVK